MERSGFPVEVTFNVTSTFLNQFCKNKNARYQKLQVEYSI